MRRYLVVVIIVGALGLVVANALVKSFTSMVDTHHQRIAVQAKN